MRRLLVLALLLSLCCACRAEPTVREEDWIENHKLVILENEFLKATVAPAFGGRLVSLVFKPTGSEVFNQEEVKKLPDAAGAVEELLEAMPKLVRPTSYPHWVLNGDVLLMSQPAFGAISPAGALLWGWLECFTDRGWGGYQGNEHHAALWDYKVVGDGAAASVELEYTTKLPPAPLRIRKTFTLLAGETRLRLRHEVTNVSDRDIAFEYCSHGCFTPGGAFDAADRLAVPVRSREGIVAARVVPTFQEPGDCVRFLPADRWVAFVDTAKRELLAHRYGFDAPIGWTWQGRTMCSLEPIFERTLAPGHTERWDDWLGLVHPFTTISAVTEDLAIAIEVAQAKDGPLELILSIGAFAQHDGLDALLTLKTVGKEAHKTAVSFAAIPAGGRALRTVSIPRDALPEGRYLAELRAGGDVLALQPFDIPLETVRAKSTHERKILWLGPSYNAIPAHLRALYSFPIIELRTPYELLPSMLDASQVACIVFTDAATQLFKEEQTAAIVEFVRSGGRLLILPIGNSSFETRAVLPTARHLDEFFQALGVGPAEGSRINPNDMVRTNFRADQSTIVDHALTRGLDWETLEEDGLWRYRVSERAEVLVRFDTGDPALVLSKVAKGSVVLYAGPINFYGRGWGRFGEEMDEFLRRCLAEDF